MINHGDGDPFVGRTSSGSNHSLRSMGGSATRSLDNSTSSDYSDEDEESPSPLMNAPKPGRRNSYMGSARFDYDDDGNDYAIDSGVGGVLMGSDVKQAGTLDITHLMRRQSEHDIGVTTDIGLDESSKISHGSGRIRSDAHYMMARVDKHSGGVNKKGSGSSKSTRRFFKLALIFVGLLSAALVVFLIKGAHDSSKKDLEHVENDVVDELEDAMAQLDDILDKIQNAETEEEKVSLENQAHTLNEEIEDLRSQLKEFQVGPTKEAGEEVQDEEAAEDDTIPGEDIEDVENDIVDQLEDAIAQMDVLKMEIDGAETEEEKVSLQNQAQSLNEDIEDLRSQLKEFQVGATNEEEEGEDQDEEAAENDTNQEEDIAGADLEDTENDIVDDLEDAIAEMDELLKKIEDAETQEEKVSLENQVHTLNEEIEDLKSQLKDFQVGATKEEGEQGEDQEDDTIPEENIEEGLEFISGFQEDIMAKEEEASEEQMVILEEERTVAEKLEGAMEEKEDLLQKIEDAETEEEKTLYQAEIELLDMEIKNLQEQLPFLQREEAGDSDVAGHGALVMARSELEMLVAEEETLDTQIEELEEREIALEPKVET